MTWLLRLVVAVLSSIVLVPAVEAGPPFIATVYDIDPDVITASDPTALVGMTATGQGFRVMFDRRVADWVVVNAYTYDAAFADGLSCEVQVNPEFGDVAARDAAEKYAAVVGKLPTALRADIQTVSIHRGTHTFGGGNHNLLIHTGQADVYESLGFLEEALLHESAHTSFDSIHAASPGWLAAQAGDGQSISTYADDNPTREDIAETVLPYLAVRYRRERLAPSIADAILRTIPNRIAYFDAWPLNLYPLAGPDPAHQSASGDISGDGKTDLLWRNTSGLIAAWQLNGTSAVARTVIAAVSADWTIVGGGDFNGDGRSDVLWRNTGGTLHLWLLDGATVAAQGSPGHVGLDWTVIGVGDVNGDARADILWRNRAGAVYVWLMDGATIIGHGSVGAAAADWHVAGVADFNGDKRDDILWRDSSGTVHQWFLDGAAITGQRSPGGALPGWAIVAIGDFNGDNNADLLWRHSSGTVYQWLLDGSSLVSHGVMAFVGRDWINAGVGDFDGDGRSDILWRHVSGDVDAWLLNGAAIVDHGSPGAASLDWQVP